ncbi:MAG: MFS transporter, partial [Demequinaceae bacterium]|nr:MFS transporter [Demequinaceae bacterium]
MVSTAPSLWRNRPYMYLLSGETVSSFGAQIAHIALSITAVNYLAATEFEVGLLGAVESVAFLFLALPAGAWVDRMSHRRVMIASNIIRAALLSLIPLAWAFGVLSISWLMWVGLGIGVCRVFFDVAFMSIVPSLVPTNQLTDANSRLHGTLEVANIAGPSVGGLLAKVISAPVLPLSTVMGFLISSFAVWRIPEPVITRSTAPRNLVHEIGEGVNFVRHHPLVSRLVLSATVTNFFSTLMMTMFPVLVLRHFGLGPGAFGFLMTVASIGAICGALAGPFFARRLGEGHAVPMTALLEGIAAFSMPLSMVVPRSLGPYVLGAGGFVVLFAILAFNVCQVSLRQRACPPRLLGRMN